MHAQWVCIIAAYPVLRLCDAGNIAALSAHGVSNTELPYESSYPRGNSAHNARGFPASQSQLPRIQSNRLINIFSSYPSRLFLARLIPYAYRVPRETGLGRIGETVRGTRNRRETKSYTVLIARSFELAIPRNVNANRFSGEKINLERSTVHLLHFSRFNSRKIPGCVSFLETIHEREIFISRIILPVSILLDLRLSSR